MTHDRNIDRINQQHRRGNGISRSSYFAQIPQSLVRDPRISRSARLLYALYHSFAPEKKLQQKPITYISQKKLSSFMGCTIQSISNWTRELKESGWITVKKRGWKSNYITLNPSPKRRRESG